MPALFLCEPPVTAAPDNASVFQGNDNVAVFDRGESVRDNEHRPSLHERVHTALQGAYLFGFLRKRGKAVRTAACLLLSAVLVFGV